MSHCYGQKSQTNLDQDDPIRQNHASSPRDQCLIKLFDEFRYLIQVYFTQLAVFDILSGLDPKESAHYLEYANKLAKHVL